MSSFYNQINTLSFKTDLQSIEPNLHLCTINLPEINNKNKNRTIYIREIKKLQIKNFVNYPIRIKKSKFNESPQKTKRVSDDRLRKIMNFSENQKSTRSNKWLSELLIPNETSGKNEFLFTRQQSRRDYSPSNVSLGLDHDHRTTNKILKQKIKKYIEEKDREYFNLDVNKKRNEQQLKKNHKNYHDLQVGRDLKSKNSVKNLKTVCNFDSEGVMVIKTFPLKKLKSVVETAGKVDSNKNDNRSKEMLDIKTLKMKISTKNFINKEKRDNTSNSKFEKERKEKNFTELQIKSINRTKNLKDIQNSLKKEMFKIDNISVKIKTEVDRVKQEIANHQICLDFDVIED